MVTRERVLLIFDEGDHIIWPAPQGSANLLKGVERNVFSFFDGVQCLVVNPCFDQLVLRDFLFLHRLPHGFIANHQSNFSGKQGRTKLCKYPQYIS